MILSRRGGEAIATGPTDLWRYLPISVLATAIVAGLPLWIVLGPARELGLLATALSIALSFGLAHLGTRAWKRWPGSRDVVFNDLMLWGYCRRVVTQRRLLKRIERIDPAPEVEQGAISVEERMALIKKLALALETGDPYTHGHSQRVARHAYLVAKTMKLPRRDAERIRLAAVIHDVGKLRTPRRIITKPGSLTEAEFDVIKRHPVDGAAMVEGLRDPELTDIVRHHHERLDGSGYPDKLRGEDISMGARVLAVADTFDAASSLRPYRPAQKHKVALDILQEDAAAGRLDPAVVDAFIRYYSGRRALRWWAFLSAGPAHIHELPIWVAQRVAAAGLANAAVVGVTATALVTGTPLHEVGPSRVPENRSDRGIVVAEERSQSRAKGKAPGAASTSVDFNDSRFPTTTPERRPRRENEKVTKAETNTKVNKSWDKTKSRPDRAVDPKNEAPGESDQTTPAGDKDRSSTGGNGTSVAGTIDPDDATMPAADGSLRDENRSSATVPEVPEGKPDESSDD